MANLAGVIKHFATASEVYTNNLSASISAGAVTVPVNANNDYTDGDIVVLTVEPGTTNEATFTGEKASTPARFINCVWTEGNVGVGHASGVTITDYDSATHFSMATKGIKLFANQDGTLKTAAVQAALNISAAVPSDYTTLAQTATTITNNGRRSQTLTFPGVNYTDRLSPGMRLRTVRSTNAPTQSAFFDGVNDYFSKAAPAGLSFTDDFVLSAWVRLTSYPTGGGAIISRYNGTSGFDLYVEPTGQVTCVGRNGGAGNYRGLTTTEALPLNTWVHITAQIDMSAYTLSSTTMYVLIDGNDVPAYLIQAGTNPTALVQAGNIEVGSKAGGLMPFTGNIAQPAIFNQKITQATAKSYSQQGLLGTETGLVSAYSLNNTLNDLSITNANNLTASGGVVATSNASPFGTQGNNAISATVDYGIIQTINYSAPDTVVVLQVAEGCTVPTSGGVASISYSSFSVPYLFPRNKKRFQLDTYWLQSSAASAGLSLTYVPLGALSVSAPIGDWAVRPNINGGGYRLGASGQYTTIAVSRSTTAATNPDLKMDTGIEGAAATMASFQQLTSEGVENFTTATPLYVIGRSDSVTGGGAMIVNNGQRNSRITLENAYV